MVIWSLFRLFLLGRLFFYIFQFHLDNCMNLYYNCIKIINTVKTHHTVHTETWRTVAVFDSKGGTL